MGNKLIITAEGLQDLQEELNERMVKVRDEIAEEIKNAREQGDLSENAAYKAAMDSKEFNENRILELEEMIKNADVVSEPTSTNKAGIGSSVKVKNSVSGAISNYELVGPSEADPSSGHISIESPLGLAIDGKKKGEKFSFQTPAGEQNYIIEDIN